MPPAAPLWGLLVVWYVMCGCCEGLFWVVGGVAVADNSFQVPGTMAASFPHECPNPQYRCFLDLWMMHLCNRRWARWVMVI